MLLLCKVDDIIANQYVIAMVGEWFDGSSHQPAEVQHQYDASYPYSHLIFMIYTVNQYAMCLWHNDMSK